MVIVSTARLVLGAAAAHATHSSVMVAGAMSMAAGECVLVRSQADSEQAALNLERPELAAGIRVSAPVSAVYVICLGCETMPNA